MHGLLQAASVAAVVVIADIDGNAVDVASGVVVIVDAAVAADE